MRYKSILTIVLISTTLLFAQKNNHEITVEEIKDHITFLASDEMEGRFSGSESLYKAAEYIQNEFESYSLAPLFEDSYLQEFSFIESVKLMDNNHLYIQYPSMKKELKLKMDYIPLSFSGNTNLNSKLVFAGYGISVDRGKSAKRIIEEIIVEILDAPDFRIAICSDCA